MFAGSLANASGKYVPKYIESLLRKYIVEYVTCQMCRSPNTTLTRDAVSRLYFVHCQVRPVAMQSMVQVPCDAALMSTTIR